MGEPINAAGLLATEAECAAGRTAPRVSLDDILANIATSTTFIAGDVFDPEAANTHPSLGVLTVTILVLQNGFTVIGKSAPASAANFDAELGAKLAHEDAVRQIWPLMGYELRERLHREERDAKFARMDEEMRRPDGYGKLESSTPASALAVFAHEAPAPQIDTPENMTRHIGTKIVDAKPMTRAVYNQLRGWDLPADENGDDEGYLVQYTDGGKPNFAGFEGYVSWSPKEQFDQAYRPL